MKKEYFALGVAALSFAALAFAVPSYAQEKTCFNEAQVIVAMTKNGYIAMTMNTAETASAIEGMRAKWPEGADWNAIRSSADTSVAFVLEANDYVKIVYFKDGCATKYTALAMSTFFEIISGTTPKKAEPAPSKSRFVKPEGGWEI